MQWCTSPIFISIKKGIHKQHQNGTVCKQKCISFYLWKIHWYLKHSYYNMFMSKFIITVLFKYNLLLIGTNVTLLNLPDCRGSKPSIRRLFPRPICASHSWTWSFLCQFSLYPSMQYPLYSVCSNTGQHNRITIKTPDVLHQRRRLWQFQLHTVWPSTCGSWTSERIYGQETVFKQHLGTYLRWFR